MYALNYLKLRILNLSSEVIILVCICYKQEV